MSQIVHLTSNNSSVVLKIGDMPELLHWGRRIHAIDTDLLAATERAVSQARLDKDVPLTLCPESGRGLFSAPGIEGHRHGKDWAPVFTLVKNELTGQRAVFTAIDETASLCLTMELVLDQESDVLQKRMTITNTGTEAQPYTLNKLSNTLPLPSFATELMTFYGSWIREFHS